MGVFFCARNRRNNDNENHIRNIVKFELKKRWIKFVQYKLTARNLKQYNLKTYKIQVYITREIIQWCEAI